MKPQGGFASTERATAAQGGDGVPQSDRSSQAASDRPAAAEDSVEGGAEGAARGRLRTPEQSGEQRPSSLDAPGAISSKGAPSGIEAAEERLLAQIRHAVKEAGEMCGLQPLGSAERVVQAHAAYTEQHLANRVQGLQLAGPSHGASQGASPGQTPLPGSAQVGPSLHRPPLPGNTRLGASDPVVTHRGWQFACHLLQSLPPGSWPDPAVLVSYLRQQGLGEGQQLEAGHFRHRVVPVTRVNPLLVGEGGRSHSGEVKPSTIPWRVQQQGQQRAPSMGQPGEEGSEGAGGEMREVAESGGGNNSERLRPFLGIDLEKVPEGDEDSDEVISPNVTPEAAAEGAPGKTGPEKKKEGGASEPNKGGHSEERAHASGEGDQDRNGSSGEPEEGKKGGEATARRSAGEDVKDPLKNHPQGSSSSVEDAQQGEGPSRTESREATEESGVRTSSPNQAAAHDPPTKVRERAGKDEGETKSSAQGEGSDIRDAAGQQGGAERVGEERGDRLRGGTLAAEAPIVGAGPMDWKDKLGEKHWRGGLPERREGALPGEYPKRKARDFGFAQQDVHKIRRRALQGGGLMANARSDFSLLQPLPGGSEGLQLQGPDDHGTTGRGPYQCKLCGAVFAYSQALGGHMRSHKQYGTHPQQHPDRLNQLSLAPPSLIESFALEAQRSRGVQPGHPDPIATALQALGASAFSLDTGYDYKDLESKDANMGLEPLTALQQAVGRPEWERPPGLANHLEVKATAGISQQGGPLTGPPNGTFQPTRAQSSSPSRAPSPKSPIIFLPGQGGSSGGWFELEPVDLEHPERISPVDVGGSPKVVAERILEALVGYGDRPDDAAALPAQLAGGATPSFSLYEPLSRLEQARILNQVRELHADESRTGGGLATMATTRAQDWPGIQRERHQLESMQPAWGLRAGTNGWAETTSKGAF